MSAEKIQIAQVGALRAMFGNVKWMDPAGPIYAKLCSILDRADDDALRAAYAAKIPFVSPLALNRMIRRGLVKSAA